MKLSSRPKWGETVKLEILSSDNGTERKLPERPFYYGLNCDVSSCSNSTNSDPGEAYPVPAYLVLGTDNATDNHTIQIIGKDDYLTDDKLE